MTTLSTGAATGLLVSLMAMTGHQPPKPLQQSHNLDPARRHTSAQNLKIDSAA